MRSGAFKNLCHIQIYTVKWTYEPIWESIFSVFWASGVLKSIFPDLSAPKEARETKKIHLKFFIQKGLPPTWETTVAAHWIMSWNFSYSRERLKNSSQNCAMSWLRLCGIIWEWTRQLPIWSWKKDWRTKKLHFLMHLVQNSAWVLLTYLLPLFINASFAPNLSRSSIRCSCKLKNKKLNCCSAVKIYTTSCRLTNDTAKASFDMGRNAHITFVARFTNYQGENMFTKDSFGFNFRQSQVYAVS